MGFVARLGGDICILRDQQVLDRAPCESALVLLIGLLSRMPDWSDRSELAARLYPHQSLDSAKVAFRTTLSRLRAWLGSSAVEENRGRLRLAEGWSLDLKRADGFPATGCLVAPGLHHSWVEEIRALWSPAKERTESVLADSFIQSVETASRVDADLARSILLGGTGLVETVSPGVMARLLGLTAPTDRRDPLSAEHRELYAFNLTRQGAIQEGMKVYELGYRRAVRERNRKVATRNGICLMFLHTEIGDLEGARPWLHELQDCKPSMEHYLLIQNGRAAFAWNANMVEEALKIMADAVPVVRDADRSQQAHFWSNYSVLAAEADLRTLSEEIAEIGRSIVVPDIDLNYAFTLDLAKGTRLIKQGLAEEAVILLEHLASQSANSWIPFGDMYSHEAKAEGYATMGDLGRARQTWRRCQQERSAMGCRLTPRLRARKERVLI